MLVYIFLLNKIYILYSLPLVTLNCWYITYYKKIILLLICLVLLFYCLWKDCSMEPGLYKLSLFILVHFWRAKISITFILTMIIFWKIHIHTGTSFVQSLMSSWQWNYLKRETNHLAIFQSDTVLSRKLPLIKANSYSAP